MKTTEELLSSIEARRDRREFMALPLETRIRNTCPGCGCRLIDNDYSRALAFVTGPLKEGRCPKCGWEGTK
jgi:predicted RNA-binding Zn-ribbon protein involved in translation (DUF1610 family)